MRAAGEQQESRRRAGEQKESRRAQGERESTRRAGEQKKKRRRADSRLNFKESREALRSRIPGECASEWCSQATLPIQR